MSELRREGQTWDTALDGWGPRLVTRSKREPHSVASWRHACLILETGRTSAFWEHLSSEGTLEERDEWVRLG